MSRTRRFKKSDIAEALLQNNGLRSYAAKALNCSPTTVMEYIQRYPELEAVEEKARAIRLEKTENKFYTLIDQDDDKKVAMTGCIFYLKTQGRKKGYVEKHEIEIPEGIVFKYHPPEEEKL